MAIDKYEMKGKGGVKDCKRGRWSVLGSKVCQEVTTAAATRSLCY